MTYPRQRESLQELAEQSKQRLRAMPQVAHTNHLDEVIPQRLCRIKRSIHLQMRCAQCEEITVLHLIHCRKMNHGDGPERRRRRPTVQIEGQTTQEEFSSSGNPGISSHRGPGTVPVEQPQQAMPPGLGGGGDGIQSL